VTARGKEDREAVRIADGEAPLTAGRERGFQGAPRQPVRLARRARLALDRAGEIGEGLPEARDPLAHRHVGQVEEVGDLTAAHVEVDQQRHHAP
jgi:hypothetical protein